MNSTLKTNLNYKKHIIKVPDEPVYHGVEAVHELGGDGDYDQEVELEEADLVALDQISQI